MGIHHLIRPLLQRVAPAAFLSLQPNARELLQQRMVGWHAHGAAAIEDALTRMNAMMGPRGDYQFQAIELFEEFIRTVGRTLVTLPFTVYVAILDDQDNVPVEKRETQHKRSVQCKHEPYPRGSKLRDEGIVVPVETKVADDGTPAAAQATEARTELIDLRRIMRSRHLRKLVWSYFRARMCMAWFAQEKLAPRTRVVLEYLKEGPFLWCTDETRALKPVGIERRLAHDHGEADRSMVYWMTVFHKKHTLIKTIDTDFIPIALLHMQHRDADPYDVLWEYKNRGTRDASYVDLRLLRKAVITDLHLTPVAFAFFCTLNGTDYVKKEWLTHFIGVEAVLAAVQRYCAAITRHFSRRDCTPTELLPLLHRVLAHAYWHGDSKTRNVLESVQSPLGLVSASATPATVHAANTKGQRTLDPRGGLSSSTGPWTPAWADIQRELTEAVENTERIKAAEAKARARAKARERAAAKRAAEGKPPAAARKRKRDDEVVPATLPTTVLRPPTSEILTQAAERIDFNMKYWMYIPGVGSEGA